LNNENVRYKCKQRAIYNSITIETNKTTTPYYTITSFKIQGMFENNLVEGNKSDLCIMI